MYVREYMTKAVITITPDTPIHGAQTLMRDNRIHHLPVVDDKGKLIGLLTERKLRETILLLAFSSTSGKLQESLLNLRAQDVMEKNVVTISPDALLSEAGHLGLKRHIGALPVIEGNGKMVGIITTTDMVKLMTQVLGMGEQGISLNFTGSIDQTKLPEIIEIIHKHQGKIRRIIYLQGPRVVKERLVIHIDVDDAAPISEELKARGYSCIANNC
jgi:acetoin utilization protein AcuB